MIDGIKIEVSPEDLRKFLTAAAERVDAQVAQVRDMIKRHDAKHADTAAPPKMFGSAGLSGLADIEKALPGVRSCPNSELLTRSLEIYEARAKMLRYAAAHVTPSTARLTLGELDYLLVGG